MSFGIPVRNGLGIGLLPSTAISTLRIGGRPALSLNFIGTNALDSRITFTRSTTATFVGSNGAIQSSSVNTPRFDYDPSTLAPRGLLIEEQRINLFLNSLIDGTSLSTQSVTVTAVPHTISFYGTGTITLAGAAVATVTGTGVYPNRRTLTFTPTVGVLVCTVTGSVQYAQIEAGSFATSFIPSAGSTATRAADVAVMTGTNFSSWYNASAGTLAVSATGYNATTVAQGGVAPAAVSLYAIAATSPYATISIVRRDAATLNSPTGYIISDAGSVGTDIQKNTVSWAGATVNAAIAWNGSTNAAFTANGLTVGTDTSYTLPTPDSLQIGRWGSESLSGYWSGWIRQVTFYNTRLSNPTLQALTT